MASVSSTSSLGNTSLRGFGGMVSGIDRDEIIEQMTLGTNTKISNAKGDITKLQWKQEAYRSLSDQIIDLTDNYSSYTSTSSLVDSTLFAKSIITTHGSDKSSHYVTATGTSDLLDSISIKSVDQLATSSVQQSAKRSSGSLETNLKDLDGTLFQIGNLQGTRLVFGGTVNSTDGTRDTAEFKFPASYKKRNEDGTIYENEKGETEQVSINYYAKTEDEVKELAKALNYALQDSEASVDNKKINEFLAFEAKENADGEWQLQLKDTGKWSSNITLLGDRSSAALEALGLNSTTDITSASQYNERVEGSYYDSAVEEISALDGLVSSVTFNYNGSSKSVQLLTQAEADAIKEMKVGDTYTDKDGNEIVLTEDNLMKAKMETVASKMQTRLNAAFGTDNVKAGINSETGNLEFTTGDETSSISISGGSATTLYNLGIRAGSTNKVNLNDTLSQKNMGISEDLLGDDLDLTINGVKIGGITKDSTISDILSKINSSKAGVKATYVDTTGQFMLVSSETGKGRQIDLTSDLAKAMFGGKEEDGAKYTAGEDAKIVVSYGNGVDVEMSRSSNTFNLEGLSVTVTGTFSGSENRVTFSAKADVDKATERVKNFIEDFNKLVEEVNNQLSARPDSSYGPLTDEQKAEMNETSIENWENKAKQGLLYSDSIIQDLSGDLQGILTKLMNSGVNYQDLERIGITYSDDYKDGGKLVFDETKFRTAMESEPNTVSNIFTGGGGVSKGLTKIVQDTLTPYATRYASRNASAGNQKGSYGRLIEEAGSEKAPSTLSNNFIYKQIQEMQERITTLQSKLKTQQDRYIKQFSSMENLISQMNSQSSWLSQITG